MQEVADGVEHGGEIEADREVEHVGTFADVRSVDRVGNDAFTIPAQHRELREIRITLGAEPRPEPNWPRCTSSLCGRPRPWLTFSNYGARRSMRQNEPSRTYASRS